MICPRRDLERRRQALLGTATIALARVIDMRPLTINDNDDDDDDELTVELFHHCNIHNFLNGLLPSLRIVVNSRRKWDKIYWISFERVYAEG